MSFYVSRDYLSRGVCGELAYCQKVARMDGGLYTGAVDEAVCDDCLGIDCPWWWSILGEDGRYFGRHISLGLLCE